MTLTDAECDAIAREAGYDLELEPLTCAERSLMSAAYRAGAATVPREPTPEMLGEAFAVLSQLFRGDGGWIGREASNEQARLTWYAMYDAAPRGPEAQPVALKCIAGCGRPSMMPDSEYCAECAAETNATAPAPHSDAAPKGPGQTVACEDCPECKGTGLRDSGGVYPWGEYITIPCDCAAPQAERSTDGRAMPLSNGGDAGMPTPDAVGVDLRAAPSTPLPNAGDAPNGQTAAEHAHSDTCDTRLLPGQGYACSCGLDALRSELERTRAALRWIEEAHRNWCMYCGGNRTTCEGNPGPCQARNARRALEGEP